MQQDKKINVLVIPDLFPRFEGDLHGIFVLDYLKSTNEYCQNTVLFGRLTGEKKEIKLERIENIEVHRFYASSKNVPKFLKPLFYLKWFWKGYKTGAKIKNIDIIHSHGTILGGTLSFLLAKKLKVPFIITEHQGPFSVITNYFWKRIWTKFIMQRADAVLAVSGHLKQEILNAKIKPKLIFVTNNPVDTELFKLRTNAKNKNILFVGRLDNFKGALRCVKAFEKIINQFPDWSFTIIGDGEDYLPIKNYIEQHKELQQKINLLGTKSKAEIANEIRAASFFIFPSKHESFGLVVAEALSSGLPVIVTNQTAPKEFVNSSNGLLVSPYDIDAIVEAIKKMIDTLPNYNSDNIRIAVIDKFGFENFGKKLFGIYQSLLNKQ